MASNEIILALQNGTSTEPLKAGQSNTVKARAGEHYRVVKLADGKGPLLDNVIAKKIGEDLQLSYADGTQVTIENYYVECQSAAACDVTLPGQSAGEYQLSSTATNGATLGDGSTLVYAHGSQDALMGMAQGNGALSTILSGFQGSELTFIPATIPASAPASDAGEGWLMGSLGGLGAAGGIGAAAGGGGGAAAAATAAQAIVAGVIVAGPVIAGNGLTVTLYAANGITILGTSALSSSGSFSIDVGTYTGVVIAKITDSSAGNDYMDEATGVAHDLNANLMAVGIASSGSVTMNVNALTTVAAIKAGAVFSGASVPTVTAAAVTENNAAVADAFGLTNLTGATAVTTVDATGAANTAYDPASLSAAEKYGAVLAAISGMDTNNSGDMQDSIDALVAGLTVSGSSGSLSPATLDSVIAGAQTAAATASGSGATGLTGVILDTLVHTSASVAIDDITSDNVLIGTEQTTIITGTNAAGATVELTIGGIDQNAIVSGGTWSYTLTGGDITAMGQGSETITATATLSGGGTATATRTVMLDTALPGVVISDDTAGTATGDVTYTFTFSEAVTGFDASDVTISAGVKGAFTAVSSTVYTLVVTPPAGSGSINVDVAAAAALDALGNSSTAAVQATQAYDFVGPTVANVAITSATGIQNSSLNAGDVVSVTVTMSEATTVTGTPQIALDIGGTIVQANYASGTGTTALVFTYTIQAAQTDANGVAIAANSLALNSGTLTDAVGNAAVITHALVIDNSGYLVDTTAPTVSSVAITSATGSQNSTLNVGDVVSVTVTMSEATTVTGTPQIDLVIGGATVQANYASGTGTTSLVFTYTILAAQTDANGISIAANSLVLNSGTLTDAAGNAATITHALVADNANYLVDTTAPTLSSSTPADDATNIAVASNIVLTFSENIAAGSGNIVISNGAGDTRTIAVGDPQVVISGTTVTINPTADLLVGSSYNVQMASGVLVDAAGNVYAGIADATTLNFSAPETAVNLSAIAAGIGGFVINGRFAEDLSGVSVASAGDVNGDGLNDLIVGAKGNVSGYSYDGRSYVVFGQSGTTAINLSDVAAGNGGFVLNGQSQMDLSGFSVAGAGDVNGDGLADLIVGAPYSDTAVGIAGRSYVVFGKTGGTPIDLSAVATGNGGFAISGENPLDQSGRSVAGAGDVNGDGLADLIVGATQDPTIHTGRSYVVFGKSGSAAVDLSAVAAGTGGFVINGESLADLSGFSVAGAGDVNGDGLADLIVGAVHSDPAAGVDAGRSYVVFGKGSMTAVDLSAILAGSGGFVINGQCADDGAGQSVASVGDVNGDGLADLIVAAPNSDLGGASTGRSYVVFGKTGTSAIDLSAVAAGSGGFVINGQCAGDTSGYSVASAGDVNGDGLTDMIVGAFGSDPAAGSNAGRSYVVFGQSGTSAIDLAVVATGSGGFVINGQCADDASGASVASAGDVNGDGLADLIVGAFGSDPAAGSNAGRSYVIFGSTSGAFEHTAVEQLGTDAAETFSGTVASNTIVAGAGDDILIGNGGADVLVGGGGNDNFVLNADNVAALAAGVSGGRLARIDGGSGIDTLTLLSGGDNLDLTLIANQGSSTAGSSSRIESIERIDLFAAGVNTLTLGYQDVLDMAGMNLINSGTQAALGWTNGTYSFAASEGRHQLIIDGDADDVANVGGVTWTAMGTVINNSNGNTYTVYNSDSGLAQVLVASAMTRNVLSNFIDLSAIAGGAGGFVITGQCAYDQSGQSVASAGDVNGDGYNDLIVGANLSDPAAGYDAGRSYVVFGKSDGGVIELSAIAAGTGGFVINGQCADDQSGWSVASAGDVNGDGLADMLVGAKFGDPAAGDVAGKSYVVFGKTSTTAVDLSAVAAASGGFVINGQCAYDQSGFSVASAGDVNGDGLTDLIVSAIIADPAAGANAGRSYVVFGKTTTTAIDLSAIAAGSGGFVIDGQCTSDYSGRSVASAGDVNGDGLADLIVGAHYGNPASGSDAGRSYVVFGKSTGAAIDLSAIDAGSGGFVINGQCLGDLSGFSVASAGDVNGDGLADLIVGAKISTAVAGSEAGRSYVVFGKSTSAAIDLSAIAAGTGGFVINGQCLSDQSGCSVASAGDINGDGLADVIVGAWLGDPVVGNNAGRTYVVFGKTGSGAIDLSAIAAGTGGFVIDGQAAYNESGWSVASAGDVNGDGLADLIVGAKYSNTAAGDYAGRSYVIFGSTTGAFIQTAVDQMGTSGDNTLMGSAAAETIVAGGGNDTLTGNGGADVLYGGAGNDNIIVNASNLAALAAGVTDGNLARIDGGSGVDTISFAGSGIALDLTAIANQGASTPGSASRIESIERIDLTGSGNNTLTVGYKDVLDMAGMNLINSGTQVALGWTNGTYTFAASEGRHQLIIAGDAGDVANVGGVTWTAMGTVSNNSNTYTVYNSDSGMAQLLVASAMTRNVPTNFIDLSAIAGGAGGFVINGECANDMSGWSVASAGDVNGDGLADLIVGAPFADPAANNAAGRSYVVFGKTGSGAVNLADIAAGSGGFVVNGESFSRYSGISVAGAGDVNGDGLADLIVGAKNNNNSSSYAGHSYVVFGKTTTAAINLSNVATGTGGFIINGEADYDESGRSVASAGDVNGDGLADLIVGAWGVYPYAGRSYVVFGKTGTTAINLTAVAAGTGGFAINGANSYDDSGSRVASAGDVNGDGLADLIVGASASDPAAGSYAGRSYVVFGKSTGSAIDLTAIEAGSGGFVINGQCADDRSGVSVAAAGDVNGDGLADLIVGALNHDPAAGSNAGRSYVVFGQTGTTAINLSAVAAGSGGFVINGQCASDLSGISVAGAGDVNGDGLADLIVGANKSDPAAGANAGRSYVVFGKTGTTALDLSAVAAGTGGFVINGQCASDESGFSVAAAGDVNGDGLADLIVGARLSVPDAGNSAGRSYVIFGSTTGAFVQTAVDQMGSSGDDALIGTAAAETIIAGAGNDTITGAGGADVLYGGAGDDSFVLNAGNLAALAAGVTNGNLARIDGGSGVDILSLSGSGITLNLTAIANQGGSTPGSASRIESIERIDLTGSGNNTLSVSYQDVLDMAGMNLINSGTQAALGWSNGTYSFAASEGRHQLIIDGDAGDVANINGSNWTAMGTVTNDNNSNTYTVYNSDTGLAQVLVANAVTRYAQANFIELAAITAGNGGFVINGQCVGERSGISMDGAGDVNGDGLADLIVGSVHDGAIGNSYLVFGKIGTTAINLSAIAAGVGGFVINGQDVNDGFGKSVAAAGDVNGDGLADLIVGATNGGSGNHGNSYVVFGKIGTAAIELSAVAAGTGGFIINGDNNGDRSGNSVASAGDVNGDGLVDLIVGAKDANSGAGRSYVVFGKTTGAAIDLSAVAAGSGGFVIDGQSQFDGSGMCVASAGDVNGDGLADIIVGAGAADPTAGTDAGRSYVVFGKAGTGVVSLTDVLAGTGGFAIEGASTNDHSGQVVSSAGDFNGDGMADLFVTAPGFYPYSAPGRAYVVFGQNTTSAISLSAVAAGTGGLIIHSESGTNNAVFNDGLGRNSIANAGDINGDGLADLIIGAKYAAFGGSGYVGRSYVVFGKTGTSAIELSAVAAGTGGFIINGAGQQNYAGWGLAAAGDINGDGLADLIVGAPGASTPDVNNAGRSYVIFGSTSSAFIQTAVDQLGTSGNDALNGTVASETIVAGAGNDTITGNGGADVLYGGAGDDNFVLNASNITALSAGVTDGQLARVDGGGGFDTFTLSGAGITLDLTAIANQGGSSPGSTSRIESIERIDLTGSGNNTLTLGLKDVLDMAGMNVFNNASGWADGTYDLAAGGANGVNPEQRHQLVVDGNAGDVVNSSGWGASVGTVTNNGHTYDVYNQGTYAQLLIDTTITRTVI